jgi:hypothetical protein
MIYTHVRNRGPSVVRSPVDRMFGTLDRHVPRRSGWADGAPQPNAGACREQRREVC